MSGHAQVSSVHLRRATAADAHLAGAICYEAFSAISRQHNFRPDIPSPEVASGLLGELFTSPWSYCLIAELGGRIVGSNCMDERSAVGGIGPLTIEPGEQNRGIGRLLMQAVLDRARERGLAGVRLVQAAFHNRSLALYAKMGFDTREPLSVMEGPRVERKIEGTLVRSAQPGDVDNASRICMSVHGLNRAGELRAAIGAGTALVVERHGRMTGYATALGFRGHAVGESNLDIQALIAAAESFTGPGLIVPTRNSGLLRWCLECGLRIAQPFTLMTIGLYNEPTGAYLPSIWY